MKSTFENFFAVTYDVPFFFCPFWQTLSQSMRQADLNFEKLKTESERLEQHTKKSVNWLLWLMLILVSFTFISMILFIRIFPRLRWWRWSLADLELLARHPPVLEDFYCTGPVAPHTMAVQAVVLTKQKNIYNLSKNICTFESQCLQFGRKLQDSLFFKTVESSVRSLLLKEAEGSRSLSHEYRKWALISLFSFLYSLSASCSVLVKASSHWGNWVLHFFWPTLYPLCINLTQATSRPAPATLCIECRFNTNQSLIYQVCVFKRYIFPSVSL